MQSNILASLAKYLDERDAREQARLIIFVVLGLKNPIKLQKIRNLQ